MATELAIESETGWHLAPSIEGKVTFSDLRSARDTADLKKELEARGAMPEQPNNFKRLREALKEDERKALEAANPRLPSEEIDQMARHFTIKAQGNVFAWINEV